MTKTYELSNERMIMADVDEKHHTATISVYVLDDLVKEANKEDILDKIRAEIEQEIIPRNSDQYDHETMWQNCGLRIALKVIDKYSGESEGKE